MIKLRRAVRIREKIDMPSGNVIEVNCNVEDQLPEIIQAYSNVMAYVDKVKEDRSYKDEFYGAYADFLSLIIGKDNWKAFNEEFEGYRNEMCEAIAPWITDTVVPAIGEASNRRLNRMKRK